MLVCHQGKDKNKRAKEKYKARKEAEKVEELNIYISCFSNDVKEAGIRISGQPLYIGGGVSGVMGKIGEEYIYLPPPPPTILAQIFKLLTGQSLRAMQPLPLATQLGQGGGEGLQNVLISYSLY